jgi:magnesium transporter
LIEWRTPWLIAGLFGGMLATSIVSAFDHHLEEVLALAFFIPVMVYMGDAVGHQTQTLFIRGIALEHVKLNEYLRREVLVDAVIGLLAASILMVFAWVFTSSLIVTWVVGISLFLNILKAGVVAIMLPVALMKLKRDPAIGGGPFTTIVQDLLSLLIYFAVASVIIL